MWFPRRMLRISWTAKKSNETVSREADTTRSLIHRILKRQISFRHVMKREKLEHLLATRMIEGKHIRRRQCEKMSD